MGNLLVSATAETNNLMAPDSVKQLSEAMSTYGIITVIMAGFLLIVFVLIGFMIATSKKQSKTIMDLFVEQSKDIKERERHNEELIDKLAVESEEQRKEIQTEKNLVAIFIRLNLVLKEECRCLQEELNCNRVAIYVYHNGSKSLSGIPFFKTTCISEWLTKRLLMKTKLHEHTDVPLGMFYTFVNDLFVNQYSVVRNRDDIKDTEPAAYEALCSTNSRSSVLVSVRNSDDAAIAGIVIEFAEPLDNDKRINAIIQTGQELSEKISLVLDYSLYSEEDIKDIQSNPYEGMHM